MHRSYYNSINDNINDRFITRREIIGRCRNLRHECIFKSKIRSFEKESLCLTRTMICR